MADNNCVGGVCTPSWYEQWGYSQNVTAPQYTSLYGLNATAKEQAIQSNLQQFYSTVGQTGLTGYMEMYPEVFDPDYKWYNDAGLTTGVQSAVSAMDVGRGQKPKEEIVAGQLQQLLKQFTGVESTYIRWMLQNRIDKLMATASQRRASTAQQGQIRRKKLGEAEQAAMEEGWVPSEEYKQRLAWAGEEPGTARAEAAQSSLERFARNRPSVTGETSLPIPEWMQPYLEPSVTIKQTNIPVESGKTQRGGTAALRPMGAQAELTPEQMGLMAGYLAYGAAGAPKSLYGQDLGGTLATMADWQTPWEQYVRQSQKLFPKATNLRTNWLTARQR